MRDDPPHLQPIHQVFDYPGVVQTISRVSGNKNVNVSRRLLASSIRAHDFDPNLWIDGDCLGTDDLVQLATLLPGDTSVQVVI